MNSRRVEDVVFGLLCGAIVEFATVSLVRIDRVVPVESVQSSNRKAEFRKAIAECSGDAIGWYRSGRAGKGAESDKVGSESNSDRAWSAEMFPSMKSAFLLCSPGEDLSLPGSLYVWSAGADEVTTPVNLGRHTFAPDRPAKQREAAPAARRGDDPSVPVVFGSRLWFRNASIVLLAAAMAGGGAFLLLREKTATIRPPGAGGRETIERPAQGRTGGIAMRVERTGSELQVSWDPHSPEVSQATAANLIVAEDERNLTLKLSPRQLAVGHLLYKSQAEDIRMDLEVGGPSGTYVESVRVAGGLPGLMAEAAPPAARVAAPAVTLSLAKKQPETAAAPENARSEGQAKRAFVPPPRMASVGQASVPGAVVPAPEAPQIAAGSVNALPDLKLPATMPPKPSQLIPVQARVEEYIGPRAIRSVQPSFDASANRTIDNAMSQNHAAHEVQVEVTIDEHGRVTKASKGSTTGPFAYLFVDAALAAARRWQFEPATAGGRPVVSKMTLKFAFVRNR